MLGLLRKDFWKLYFWGITITDEVQQNKYLAGGLFDDRRAICIIFYKSFGYLVKEMCKIVLMILYF